jgi:purine-binding chemotaxis protein CheW
MDENRQERTQQLLTFMLGAEIYAIEVIHIKEVLVVPKITRVPRMPEYLNGVINLRGNVIPVLDLRLKFGIGATEITESTSIIVTEMPSFFHDGEDDILTIGIFSDGVEQVIEMPEDSIGVPPQIGTTINTDFITGVGKYRDNFVIILNLAKLLSEQELMVSCEQSESAYE